jgi:hypothetical protein
MNRDILLQKDIERILTEELSVSDEVKNTVEYIIRYITIENTPASFKFNFFNTKEITVDVKYVTISEFLEAKEKAFVDFQKEHMFILVPLYDGKPIIPLLRDSLFHEINHIHEISKERYNNDNSCEQLYSIAIEELSKPNLTKKEEEIARTIYNCSHKEQDAYANELYSNLTNSFNNEDEIIRTSGLYNLLLHIRATKQHIKDSRFSGRYDYETSKYGRSKEWFYWLCDHAEIRAQQKLRHVIIKAQKDKYHSNSYPLSLTDYEERLRQLGIPINEK